jgi:hypothetical protein
LIPFSIGFTIVGCLRLGRVARVADGGAVSWGNATHTGELALSHDTQIDYRAPNSARLNSFNWLFNIE